MNAMRILGRIALYTIQLATLTAFFAAVVAGLVVLISFASN